MNNQIKIVLNIEGISGATLRKEGKIKVPYTLTKKDLHWKNHHQEYKGEDKDKIVYKGVKKINNYVEIPAKMTINMSQDAYDYYTSKEVPTWYYKKDWAKLPITTKLEMHLQKVCEDYRGKSFTYLVLED